jgi:hypothetical protein
LGKDKEKLMNIDKELDERYGHEDREENLLLKMLNPRYKELFELVGKRGVDELKESHPELMEQIRKELILSGLGSEAERLFMSKDDWKRNVNNHVDEW